jgi:hypothetical protein
LKIYHLLQPRNFKEIKMGEWSDYFEDFPEENPANYIDGRFDPVGARRLRQ